MVKKTKNPEIPGLHKLMHICVSTLIAIGVMVWAIIIGVFIKPYMTDLFYGTLIFGYVAILSYFVNKMIADEADNI